MSIRFIPNDPLAGRAAPGITTKTQRKDRPLARAHFTLSNGISPGIFEPGTPEFLFWQCREAALAALETWESFSGKLTSWQGNRKALRLLHDEGEDLNAFYDRSSFAFFHQTVRNKTFFSGASTDVVVHEIGHGLLDAIRPDLWSVPFLEVGALHESFGDCMAVLNALHDKATRQKLLKRTKTLRKHNFVETTAEELSDGIRRLIPTHNAAKPRQALNTFQFQLPETLPDDGGPGELINEVHSFGMVFSGCFYDLISGLFAAQKTHTESALLRASRIAGALLVSGAKSALATPRFFQSVGRGMVLADEQLNGGANRDIIRNAFQQHGILLGTNAMLAPTVALAGSAPTRRGAAIGAATRRDLLGRLGGAPSESLSVEPTEVAGQRFTLAVHKKDIPLDTVDRRLKGVSVTATVPVVIGDSGGRAAILGHVPEPTATDQEVKSFVQSLLTHGHIAFENGKRTRAVNRGGSGVRWATHHVVSSTKGKTLERLRFCCAR